MIRANKFVKFVRADVVAECLDVSQPTYIELWNKCVPLYDDLPKGECPGEMDYNLLKYGWKLLSDAAKTEVNKATKEYFA